MKISVPLLAFLLFFGTILSQSVEISEFEGSTIDLWKAYEQSVDNRQIKFRYVEMKNRARLLNLHSNDECICHQNALMNIDVLVEEINSQLNTIDNCLIDELCQNILEESFKLRHCLGEAATPLELLIQTYQFNEEISTVVNDQMMDLKYWFEFLDLVNSFVESWDRYACLTSFEIKESYPFINPEIHKIYLNEVRNCTDLFLDSMQSADRKAMVQPCDDLQENLQELIFSYSMPLVLDQSFNAEINLQKIDGISATYLSSNL